METREQIKVREHTFYRKELMLKVGFALKELGLELNTEEEMVAAGEKLDKTLRKHKAKIKRM